MRQALSPLSYRRMWGDQAGSLKTAANRITICRAADYTMITMRMECAIGVEPIHSTLCRREPWPLGYVHIDRRKLPGMDSNHHQPDSRIRRPTVSRPGKERVGEGGF